MSAKDKPTQSDDDSSQVRDFTIRLNRCDPAQCEKVNKLSLKASYPTTVEFDHLKRYKAVVASRISKQRVIIGKISRKNFKYIDEAPFDALKALSQHDLKLLVQIRASFDSRISQLRQKIHQEMLGNCRSDDFQLKETANGKK